MNLTGLGAWITISVVTRRKQLGFWRNTSRKKWGRMLPMSFKAAVQRYPGSSLRVAAQGILDKPDGGHRIIHDGAHGVQLSNEINIVDRLENPGPGSWRQS